MASWALSPPASGARLGRSRGGGGLWGRLQGLGPQPQRVQVPNRDPQSIVWYYIVWYGIIWYSIYNKIPQGSKYPIFEDSGPENHQGYGFGDQGP